MPSPKLWNHKSFLRLWGGQTISVLGSAVGGFALQFVALQALKATPFQVALLGMFAWIPGMAIGLWAGVLVDRFPRKPMMIWADVGRFLALVSIPIAAALGRLSMTHLYVVALIHGVLGTFFDVAYYAFLPSLVEKDALVDGNAKLAASVGLAETAGFGFAGWLVQWLTAPFAVLIDAMSFLVSALSLGSIPKREAEVISPSTRSATSRHGIGTEIREGFLVIGRDEIVRTLVGSGVMLALFNRIYGSVLIVFATRDLGLSPGVQGLIYGVGGFTSLLGALATERITRRLGLGNSLLTAMILISLGMIATTFARGAGALSIGLMLINQLLTDPAWALQRINELSLRQSLVPNEVLGRVNGAVRFLEFGASLLGMLLGGFLSEVWSVRTALRIGALDGFVAALWILCSPVRRIRALPSAIEGRPNSEGKDDLHIE